MSDHISRYLLFFCKYIYKYFFKKFWITSNNIIIHICGEIILRYKGPKAPAQCCSATQQQTDILAPSSVPPCVTSAALTECMGKQFGTLLLSVCQPVRLISSLRNALLNWGRSLLDHQLSLNEILHKALRITEQEKQRIWNKKSPNSAGVCWGRGESRESEEMSSTEFLYTDIGREYSMFDFWKGTGDTQGVVIMCHQRPERLSQKCI